MIQFSDEITQQVAELARKGCQNKTIANITGIANNTLKRRFGKLLMKSRSERRMYLRECQWDLAKTNPAMAIFLGKNELGQVDKQTISQESATTSDLTPEEQRHTQAAIDAYKASKARADLKVRKGA